MGLQYEWPKLYVMLYTAKHEGRQPAVNLDLWNLLAIVSLG